MSSKTVTGMKLIYDIDSQADVFVTEELNENTGQKQKTYKIKGIFSTIGTKNQNGRIYPKKLWETEVIKYQDILKSGHRNALMEWEHPPRTQVDMMEAVQRITSLEIKGDHVIGEAVLLDNVKANQIKTLIENDIKISVSSRGVGSVKNGIVENFKLVTYDIVSDPSDFNQTMNGIVESKGEQFMLSEGILQDKSFQFDDHGNIIESHDPQETVVTEVDSEDILDSVEEVTEKAITEDEPLDLKTLNEDDQRELVKAFINKLQEEVFSK